MKKQYSQLVRILCLIVLPFFSMAQSFEGSIRYSMQLKGNGSAELAAVLPREMKLKIKGDKIRTEIVGGMMESMMGIMISNPAKGVNCILNNTIKMAYTLDIDTSNSDEPTSAKATGKKERIAGYSCEEFILEMANGEKSSIWITNQLQFPKVKGSQQNGLTRFLSTVPGGTGMPMRVSQKVGDSEMVIEVIDVKKERINDQLFEIPEGYQTTPFNPSIFGGDEGDE